MALLRINMVFWYLLLAMQVSLGNASSTDDVDDMIAVNSEYAKEMFKSPPSQYLTAVKATWLWRNGLIPYKIVGKFSKQYQIDIAKAMTAIESESCIRFRHYDPKIHTDVVHIQQLERHCQSTVGRGKDPNDGNKSHVDLNEKGCLFGTIIHELMHTVGFEHEHSRQDRDQQIEVNMKNVADKDLNNFDIFYHGEYLTPYDYNSIMHYRTDSFSKNGQPTIVAKYPIDGMEIGQRKQLSTYDIVKLNRHYHCYETAACLDKLPNCSALSMNGRYCEKRSVKEIVDTCIRTCGMCRHVRRRRTKEERRKAAKKHGG